MKLLEKLHVECPECITFLLSNRLVQIFGKNVTMLFVYISPEGSIVYGNDSSDDIELLYEHILLLCNEFPECLLFLSGDFNARTKYLLDLISDDSLEFIFGDVACSNDPLSLLEFPRKNKDSNYNSFGISLVDMCSVLDTHILNGRGFQDREGHITCISGNGSSVVDYCIVSSDLFQFVINF